MRRLDRAVRAYLRGHEVAASATSEKELWDTLCAVAVEKLGYRLAWVGLKGDDGRVLPVAQAGFGDGYLDTIRVTWTDDDLGQGPTGTAIRTGHTSVAQDLASDERYAPWRTDALSRGYLSSAAIPLLHGTRAIGALNLYAPEPDAFEAQELALLEALATTLTASVLRLRTSKELEPLSDALEQVARAQTASTVTAAVAHDLNNLLMVASMSIDLSRLTTSDADDSKGHLEEASQALQSAARLTGQLMALSREERSAEESEVDRVLSELRGLLSRLAGRARVEMQLDAPGGRAPIATLELERIVINLVLNAAHAIDGEGRIEIASRLRPATEKLAAERPESGRFVVLTVTDDGPGIPKDLLHRLFDPYVTTKQEGTGLGLSSVRALAREAGGDVTVESAEGRGARFDVWFPCIEG